MFLSLSLSTSGINYIYIVARQTALEDIQIQVSRATFHQYVKYHISN